MRIYRVESLRDLVLPARELVASLGETPLVCFYGEMGAGKTTFIKVICECLGVEDATSSPSFSIVNQYESGSGHPVYHFDFYRIKNEQEALDVGVEEYFYSGDVCLVEWPEMIKGLLPEKHLKIVINLVATNERRITITTVA